MTSKGKLENILNLLRDYIRQETVQPIRSLFSSLLSHFLGSLLLAFGIILISSSLQGYLIGIGNLKKSKHLEWPIRIMLGLSGILMALPGGNVTGYSNYEINIFATALFVLPISYLLILKLKNN